jgi:hypothetical protein
MLDSICPDKSIVTERQHVLFILLICKIDINSNNQRKIYNPRGKHLEGLVSKHTCHRGLQGSVRFYNVSILNFLLLECNASVELHICHSVFNTSNIINAISFECNGSGNSFTISHERLNTCIHVIKSIYTYETLLQNPSSNYLHEVNYLYSFDCGVRMQNLYIHSSMPSVLFSSMFSMSCN